MPSTKTSKRTKTKTKPEATLRVFGVRREPSGWVAWDGYVAPEHVEQAKNLNAPNIIAIAQAKLMAVVEAMAISRGKEHVTKPNG